jgi:hypothetical protein
MSSGREALAYNMLEASSGTKKGGDSRGAYTG